MHVFLFLSSGNCSIDVVKFVAEETCLPSSFLQIDCLFRAYYSFEFRRGGGGGACVCGCLCFYEAGPTIAGFENL
jgi:hypothetical protein